uniref:Uncharacterized protein n=1 Tax=Aegilops tauschii subsp. strangulata TaxID=200361 RepID=A0A453T3S1_AEGTS
MSAALAFPATMVAALNKVLFSHASLVVAVMPARRLRSHLVSLS